MKHLLLAILCAVAIATAVAQQATSQSAHPACVPPPFPGPQRVSIPDFSGNLPAPDYLDATIACNTPTLLTGTPAPWQPDSTRSASPWLEAEHQLYRHALASQKVDVLVAPFQVQGYGLDRIERALMTADLAYAIGSTGKYSVANPWLASRALGEGMRRLENGSVGELARSIGARWIVQGYVGHDDHHAFTLTLQVEEISPPSSGLKLWQRDFRAVTFTDERTPALAFHDMLPDVIGVLPMGLKLAHPAATSTRRNASRINVSPRDLVGSSNSSVSPLAALDTLGALSAADGELPRERLFEHALLTALNSPENDSEKKFLTAYALFSLGRRPVALAVLGGEKAPRAETLRALLDGNLPAAAQAITKLPPSLEELLLQISLRELQGEYGRKQNVQPIAIASIFGEAAASWQPLVQLRLEELDRWSDVEPAVIKVLLDHTLPEPGLDLQSFRHGSALTNGAAFDQTEVDLENIRHVRRAAQHTSVSAFGNPESLRPQTWDLLWLLESRAEGRVIKHLRRSIQLQGLPEAALDDLTHYAPLLSGHPALEVMHAEAAVDQAQKSPDDTRASWQEQSNHSALLAAYWAPGQNQTSRSALLAVSMGIPPATALYMGDAYSHDYPRRAFWPAVFFGAEDPRLRSAAELEALAFSSWDISPLQYLPSGNQPGQAGAVLASLGDRFTGNPQKPEATNLGPGTAPEDPQALIARLRKAIKADPEPWDNYASLGQQIVASGGSYTEASQAFMSYPGFKDAAPDDPVALSNRAYDAGTTFYRAGRFDLAKPFYEISANLETGSLAGMISKTRLELLAVDYPHATVDMLARASRYSDAYGYRDYLSFLHAYGAHDEAWRAFLQVDSSFELPEVWASALVGHHLQGADDHAIREWLHRPEIRGARFKTRQFAPYYAVLWNTTDRMPPSDLGKLVEELEGPPAGHIDLDGITLLVPHPVDPKGLALVRPSPLRADKVTKLPSGTPIKSELAYFADAYAALRAGNYDVAVTRFVAMADRYPIEEGYPLAYFAYAAAQTGDSVQLEQYLDTLHGHPAFDYWLARAFFAAGHKNVAAAQTALEQAFRNRPGTEDRPILTEYQYAEACEWLYQQTRDVSFADKLLWWVKTAEVSQPTQAWAYAMEYAYSPPGEARTRALAMAHYLDPKSSRIQSATDSERRDADAWFKVNNPFRLPTADRNPAQPQI